MIKRWIFVIALLLSISNSIFAEDTTIFGIHGTWWNSNYDGEGFILEQYDDGLVIGYWYTYDQDGNQLWMVGTGILDGDRVDLEMTITEGGLMGSTQNPDLVQREIWGIVSLELVSCQRINMTFQGADESSGGYQLHRLVSDGLTAAICENTEAPKAALQSYSYFSGYQDRSIPLVGTATLQTTVIGGGDRISHFQYRLIAAEGDIKIKNISTSDASGIAAPSVDGISENMVIKEGEYVSFSLSSGFTNGQTAQVNYSIELYDIGDLIDLDVTLKTN